MPPSRRDILRVGSLSLPLLGGCTLDRSPTWASPTNTSTNRGKKTSSKRTSEENGSSDSVSQCQRKRMDTSGWRFPEGTPGRTSYVLAATGPATTPDREWTVTADKFENHDGRFTRPIISDGRVYACSVAKRDLSRSRPDKQRIVAMETQTGQRVWTTIISGRPTTILLAGGNLFASTANAVHCLDPRDGTVRWKEASEGRVGQVTAQTDGVVLAEYRQQASDRLVALDDSGQQQWSADLPLARPSGVARAGGRIYVVGANRRLHSLDSTSGELLWRHSVPTDGGGKIALAATPCNAVVATEGALSKVNRDGTRGWARKTEAWEVAVDHEQVYTVDGDGYARAYSLSDGSRQWSKFVGSKDSSRTDGFGRYLAVDSQRLYTGTVHGSLMVFDTETGNREWKVDCDAFDVHRVSISGEDVVTAIGTQLLKY